eukprot:878462-Alexandrium_andersonii.AAC.1
MPPMRTRSPSSRAASSRHLRVSMCLSRARVLPKIENHPPPLRCYLRGRPCSQGHPWRWLAGCARIREPVRLSLIHI